jgi:hypothetical protein
MRVIEEVKSVHDGLGFGIFAWTVWFGQPQWFVNGLDLVKYLNQSRMRIEARVAEILSVRQTSDYSHHSQ